MPTSARRASRSWRPFSGPRTTARRAMEPGKPHTLETDAPRAGTTSVSCRTFPADRTAPRAAATWLRAVASGLSPSRLADAELCMDELVTNVVRYGWADTDPGPRSVTLRIDRIGCEVEITVEDAGRPFDPTAAPLAPIAHSLARSLRASPTSAATASTAPRSRFRWRAWRRRKRSPLHLSSRAKRGIPFCSRSLTSKGSLGAHAPRDD